jgi:hypothetical protein
MLPAKLRRKGMAEDDDGLEEPIELESLLGGGYYEARPNADLELLGVDREPAPDDGTNSD